MKNHPRYFDAVTAIRAAMRALGTDAPIADIEDKAIDLARFSIGQEDDDDMDIDTWEEIVAEHAE